MATSTTTLKFPCPSCSRNLSAGPDLFGNTLNCPNCGATIQVPTLSVRPEPAKTEVIGPRPASVPDSATESDYQSPDEGSARGGPKAQTVGTIVGFLVAAWIAYSLRPETGIEGSAVAGDNAPVESRSQTERAENITRQMVSAPLKSPSTASFTEFRIIDQNGPFFQTYTGVDAMNGFGAIVRSYFVCAFKLDEGLSYSTHRMTAVTEVGSFDHRMFKGPSVPEQEIMSFQKHCLGWPGYESADDAADEKIGSSEASDEGRPEQESPAAEKRKLAEAEAAKVAAKEAERKAEREEAARFLERAVERDRVNKKVAEEMEKKKQPATGSGDDPFASDGKSTKTDANLPTDLTAAKAELEKVSSTIASERARWQEAFDTINRLTARKTKAVVDGSPAYHQCLAASKVIHEVEQGAQALKDRKAALEARVKELEK